MVSYTKCPACGAIYDSNTRHICSKGESLEKAYFGSEEKRGEVGGDGYNSPDR